ncbi:MAG: HAD-IB family phosphatase [bacterium]
MKIRAAECRVRKAIRPQSWAVVTDFDATITDRDAGDTLLLHFGICTPEEINRSYGKSVVLEEWMKRVFRRVRLSDSRIAGFVRNSIRIRPGFMQFVSFCRKKGIPLEIVSGGLDVYAAPFFNRWRIKGVKSYMGKTRREGQGLRVSYPFLKGLKLDEFKAHRVRVLKRNGYRVLFMGDGTADFPGAKAADAVFSRLRLHKLCREGGVKTRKLTDFHAVRRFLQVHS